MDDMAMAQYLALERELYEESIQNLEKKCTQLQQGTLQEYLDKCQDITNEVKQREDLAKLHYELELKNIQQLLEFDIQQAEHIYQEALENIEIEETRSKKQKMDPVPVPTQSNTVKPSRNPLCALLEDSSTDVKKNFNMTHLEYVTPCASEIAEQLLILQKRWQDAKTRAEAKDTGIHFCYFCIRFLLIIH